MKGKATLIGNTPITKDTNHVLNTSLDKLNYGIKWYHVPTTVRKGPSLLEVRNSLRKERAVLYIWYQMIHMQLKQNGNYPSNPKKW